MRYLTFGEFEEETVAASGCNLDCSAFFSLPTLPGNNSCRCAQIWIPRPPAEANYEQDPLSIVLLLCINNNHRIAKWFLKDTLLFMCLWEVYMKLLTTSNLQSYTVHNVQCMTVGWKNLPHFSVCSNPMVVVLGASVFSSHSVLFFFLTSRKALPV